MNIACQIASIPQQNNFWLFLAGLIILIITILMLIWIIQLIFRINEKAIVKIFYFFLSLFASTVFFIFISIVTLIALFIAGLILDDYPPSARYHVLNAAIKNTCFLDPQRNNCPKTAEGVISIEDVKFRNLTKDAHLTYKYYPETNEYTLIIRNNNLRKNNSRVAIFDPRLTTVKNYGKGVDFIDTRVIYCDGKYTLVNPPPFPGPWDQIK